MPSTVQLQYFKFLEMVSPRDPTGVSITLATAGTVDTDKWPAQRLLDFYNEARMVAAFILSYKKGPRERQEASNNVIVNSSATFASGVLAKPDGYIFTKSLLSSAGVVISVLPVDQIPLTKHYDSPTNPIVYEYTTEFRSANGSTNIPNGGNYVLNYVGITPFVLADVTGGTKKETFSDIYEPIILQLAAAIEETRGQQKPLALAEKLLGGQ